MHWYFLQKFSLIFSSTLSQSLRTSTGISANSFFKHLLLPDVWKNVGATMNEHILLGA